MYIYNDDNDTIYLSNVFVNNEERNKGIGNAILSKAFEDGLKLGASYICLKCNKTSWVHNWYNNNGFEDICDDEEDSNYIWMKRKLIDNEDGDK